MDHSSKGHKEAAPVVVPAEPAYVFKKERTTADNVALAFIALMIISGIAYYQKFPDKITAYIDASSAGLAPKYFALFALPLAGALVYIVLKYVPPILAAHGKRVPGNTIELLKPATLAYFAYTQASIIAFNASNIKFSPMQNMSVITGIGIAYAAAFIFDSRKNILPKMMRGATESQVAAFNMQTGKAIALWSFMVFLGFFREKYTPAMFLAGGILALASTTVRAYNLRKIPDISDAKQGVEGKEAVKKAP